MYICSVWVNQWHIAAMHKSHTYSITTPETHIARAHSFTTGLRNSAIYGTYHFHCFSSRCPIEPAAFSSSSNQALVLSWWSPLGQVGAGEEWGLWWGGLRKHLHTWGLTNPSKLLSHKLDRKLLGMKHSVRTNTCFQPPAQLIGYEFHIARIFT